MSRGTKYNYEDYHRINEKGELEKRCTTHFEFFSNESEWLPCSNEYFYTNDKNNQDGLHPNCKECQKKKANQWKLNNPDKLKIANKKQNDKPEHKALHRAVEKKRREIGKTLEWQRNNSEKISKYNSKRREHKTHDVNKDEWKSCKEYFNNCCAYCGKPITEHYRMYGGKLQNIDLHKEHVIHGGSNGLDNCVPSCQECNSEKHDFIFDEWYNVNNIKFNNERNNKIQKWLQEDHKKYIIQDKKPKGKYTKNPNNPKWKAS